MSSAAMKWARRQTIAHSGLRNLVTTLAVAVDKTGCTWQSQATLAADMSVSVRCVRYWLGALDTLGLVQRAHRSNGRGGRTSDLIRLRLDRDFTITREGARAVLQAARGAGRNPSSKRQKLHFQQAPGADDQGSDQLKEVLATQEDLAQVSQSALGRTLRVVNGGRA